MRSDIVYPKTSRRFVTLVLGLTMLLAGASTAWAAPQPDEPEAGDEAAEADDPRPPISLSLSPAVLEVPLSIGPSTHTLQLHNAGSQPLQVIAELAEFTVATDGATRFAGPDEVGATAWVDLDVEAFELAVDERREVEVTVDVPGDAEPGERYVSVIFAVPGRAEEGNVVVTHRVAAKLYVSVPGQKVEHVDLGELTGPWLVDSRAATFDLEVRNHGNVHRRFEEDGRLVAASGEAEFPVQNFAILGGSTRVVQAVWPDPPTVCWCTVEVAMDDGQGNLATASTRVLMFPLRLTLGLLALTAGLAMLTAARRRRTARAAADGARVHGRATPQPVVPPPPVAQVQHASADVRVAARDGATAFVPSAGPTEHGDHRGQPPTTRQPSAPRAPDPALVGAFVQAAGRPAAAEQPVESIDTSMFTARGSGRRGRRRR